MSRLISVRALFNFFLCVFILCLEGRAEAKDYVVNGEVYNDETVADLVTVITTTNPIPSIPDIWHIEVCQRSLMQIPAFLRCRKIIVCDGIQPGYEHRTSDYDVYKQRIVRLTQSDPAFSHAEVVFCSKWMHLAGAVKEAIKLVKTPFIFFHQHDFLLKKSFDLNGVIASMVANPQIKHVRLNQNPRADSYTVFDGPVDEVVQGSHFVPLTRCFGWSDNDHVTRLDYYADFVLPHCFERVSMEWDMHPWFQDKIAEHGHDAAHAVFGTYIYGQIADGNYIFHTDGKNH